MSVARVAVGAAESAADVRINGPEAHARGFGTVEDALGGRGVVADVLLLADDGELAGFLVERCSEEAGILRLHVPNIRRKCGSGKIEVQLNGSKVRGAGDRN